MNTDATMIGVKITITVKSKDFVVLESENGFAQATLVFRDLATPFRTMAEDARCASAQRILACGTCCPSYVFA